MMRICYLAPANSSHIDKWTKYMSAFGHEVHVVSLTDGKLDEATVHILKQTASPTQSDFSKLRYLTRAREAAKVIKGINPDIVHVHYATSYGLLASLSIKQSYILSIWGSDVYEFPKRSFVHRAALQHSLTHARWLMSTSRAMADEASAYTDKDMMITPFGVDMNMFSPKRRTRREDGRFVVGTVKGLEKKYGIDCLLSGVAMARRIRPDIPFEVRIAGKGSHETALRDLADAECISDITYWLGYISQDDAAKEWANMDVAVVTSENESFGVSAVEAQASGVPVIYTDIPGLKEACDNGKQGICIPKHDKMRVAQELIKLYDNSSLRKELGESARVFASDSFEINSCFRKVEKFYLAHYSH